MRKLLCAQSTQVINIIRHFIRVIMITKFIFIKKYNIKTFNRIQDIVGKNRTDS